MSLYHSLQCFVLCHKLLKPYFILLLGAERCSEALQKLAESYDIVVNIQGDEPLIEPEIIDGIVQALQVCFSQEKTIT
jgi:CMP-2-keto-3-deoxyoctulosonic acid synthetase